MAILTKAPVEMCGDKGKMGNLPSHQLHMVLGDHLPRPGIRTPDLPGPKVLSIRPPRWYVSRISDSRGFVKVVLRQVQTGPNVLVINIDGRMCRAEEIKNILFYKQLYIRIYAGKELYIRRYNLSQLNCTQKQVYMRMTCSIVNHIKEICFSSVFAYLNVVGIEYQPNNMLLLTNFFLLLNFFTINYSLFK